MQSMKSVFAIAAAMGLGVAPVAAQAATTAAAPAASASALNLSNVSKARASTHSSKKSHLASGAIIPLVLAAGVVAGGIVIATDDNDRPDSN